MDPWILHIAKSVDAEPGIVRLAIGHVFGFLLKRYPKGEADELVNIFPGAREAVADAAKSPPPKKKFSSRVLGTVGDWIGGRKGDMFEVTSNLMALGFTTNQLKRLAHEIFGGATLVLGREKVQSMTDPIPGLSAFLWLEEKAPQERKARAQKTKGRKK